MGTYRLEEASTGRAGCQNKECKDEKIKITKGELRLGTWVDTERFQSFFWRHWGCVTPKIVTNLKETLDEANGDYAAIDGYEELSSQNQNKVREAIEEGHIADSDWKGDVEMNRPGKTGFRVKTPKKKSGKENEEEEDTHVAKKARTGAKGAGKAQREDASPKAKKPKKEIHAAKDHAEPPSPEEEAPVKKRGRPAKSTTSAEKKTEKETKSAAKAGKRKITDEGDADVDTAAVEDHRPSKKGRKSAGAEESVPVEDKPRRGRKKATTTQEREADKAQSENKPARGRKKASA